MISSVIGLGKLGFPFALFLASKKQKVICYDSNKKILNDISNLKSPYVEPKTSSYLKKYYKNIHICEDLEYLINKSQISHLVLPTPSLKNNSFSNSFILRVLDKIGSILLKKKNKKHIINITSTVMPESCNIFSKFLSDKGLIKNKDFLITYNPHFIAQGTTIKNLEDPDFILIGSDCKDGKKLISYYDKIYKKKIKISYLNTVEAEIAKISVNSYITTKITFSNFISEICQNTKNVDANKVLKTIGEDHRIGHDYLGIGTKYSGPCFPRDNKALNYFINGKSKYSLPKYIDKINNEQTNRLIEMINKSLKNKYLKKIGIFGLTYKDKTNIIKDSQSYDLIIKLRKRYQKKINVFDKNVKPSSNFVSTYKLSYFENINLFIKESDLLILMYPNKEIVKKILKSKRKLIIDCWNLIDPNKTRSKIVKLGNYY